MYHFFPYSQEKHYPEYIRKPESPVGSVEETVDEDGDHNYGKRKKEKVSFFLYSSEYRSEPPEEQKAKSAESDESTSEPKSEEDIVRFRYRPFEIGREIPLIREIALPEISGTDTE